MKTIEFTSIFLLSMIVLPYIGCASIIDLQDATEQLKNINESIRDLDDDMKVLIDTMEDINQTFVNSSERISIPLRYMMLVLTSKMDALDNAINMLNNTLEPSTIDTVTIFMFTQMILLSIITTILAVDIYLKIKK